MIALFLDGPRAGQQKDLEVEHFSHGAPPFFEVPERIVPEHGGILDVYYKVHRYARVMYGETLVLYALSEHALSGDDAVRLVAAHSRRRILPVRMATEQVTKPDEADA